MVNVCLGEAVYRKSVIENKKCSGIILNTIVWRHLQSQDAIYMYVIVFI